MNQPIIVYASSACWVVVVEVGCVVCFRRWRGPTDPSVEVLLWVSHYN